MLGFNAELFDVADPFSFLLWRLEARALSSIRAFTVSLRSRVSCYRTCCLRKRAIRILVEAPFS